MCDPRHRPGPLLGFGGLGRLGYGNQTSIGDDELPGTAGPVDLGLGRTALAIGAGSFHTCAELDTGAVRGNAALLGVAAKAATATRSPSV